jgi:hypothetical protein
MDHHELADRLRDLMNMDMIFILSHTVSHLHQNENILLVNKLLPSFGMMCVSSLPYQYRKTMRR